MQKWPHVADVQLDAFLQNALPKEHIDAAGTELESQKITSPRSLILPLSKP